jgi:hypothetical protein
MNLKIATKCLISNGTSLIYYIFIFINKYFFYVIHKEILVQHWKKKEKHFPYKYPQIITKSIWEKNNDMYFFFHFPRTYRPEIHKNEINEQKTSNKVYNII